MSFVQITAVSNEVSGQASETVNVWVNAAHVNSIRAAGDRMGQATIAMRAAAHTSTGKFSEGKDLLSVDTAPATLAAADFPNLVCVKEFDRSSAKPSTDAFVNPDRIKTIRRLANFYVLHFTDGSELDVADPAPLVTKTI